MMEIQMFSEILDVSSMQTQLTVREDFIESGHS
jgi:hypothetical protein